MGVSPCIFFFEITFAVLIECKTIILHDNEITKIVLFQVLVLQHALNVNVTTEHWLNFWFNSFQNCNSSEISIALQS